MRVLDLFSGIGGFSLGLERAGMRTVAFCEIDPYCRAVLRKHWPDVPIFEDVCTLRGEDVGPVDVVCGGFPCQPWSTAGKRGGEADDRDLWPEMRRVIETCGPRWVLGENVPGLDDPRYMGLDRVLSDLEALGYAAGTAEIPACAVDAPHKRMRLWIVAHRERPRLEGYTGHEQGSNEPGRINSDAHGSTGGLCRAVAHYPQHGRGSGRQGRSDSGGAREPEQPLQALAHAAREQPHGAGSAGPRRRAESPDRRSPLADADGGPLGRPAKPRSECGFWLPEPGVGRVAHGIPNRVDRLRALGNAVVPQVVEEIGRAIMQAERRAVPDIL